MSTLTNSHDKALLSSILENNQQPFAIIHRPESMGNNSLEVLLGPITQHDILNDIKLNEVDKNRQETIHDKLILMPYGQIKERNLVAKNDNVPLIELDIQEQGTINKTDFLLHIDDQNFEINNAKFDISDDEYANLVDTIIKDEIGRGTGASFVIQRSYIADLKDYDVNVALSIYKRLLQQETGAYWTFIVHTGDLTLIGATPERHISFEDSMAIMNPISGTFRYPSTGPKLSDLTTFLNDKKEIEELFMVVDEELKMMARVCDDGGIVEGPNLKEMAQLAHTEYYIKGKSSLPPLEILKETMFAPSVTGSPQESAAHVIHKYESRSRSYYSGVIALVGQTKGQAYIDSGILIRSAEIQNDGSFRLSVGATLVRDSDPFSEAEETKAKASGLLKALGFNKNNNFKEHALVNSLLASRNQHISEFWLKDRSETDCLSTTLKNKNVLIVDAEDTFTSMIDHQFRALGCHTTVLRFDEPHYFHDDYDLIVMGPGPGDPRDLKDKKIETLHSDIKSLLDSNRPFLAICLSHQVLSSIFGLDLIRRDHPNQGVQKEIELFGIQERVGFYNTFSARCNHTPVNLPRGLGLADICFDQESGEVHAIKGNNFISVQFHPESILTIDGVQIFERLLCHLLDDVESFDNVA